MDKIKTKPAKKAPETGSRTEAKARGFGDKKSEAVGHIAGTHHKMRMGDPEDNVNAGNPGNSIAMAAKGKKDGNRKKRNKGR